MEDYSKEDVINALSSLNNKSRERVLVDQRSYLIGILAYKFGMTEHAIADIVGIRRITVNYNKKRVIELLRDKGYMANVYVYANMFPFDFKGFVVGRINKQVKLELTMEQKSYNKLKTLGHMLKHKDVESTIIFLLEKSFKLWEE